MSSTDALGALIVLVMPVGGEHLTCVHACRNVAVMINTRCVGGTEAEGGTPSEYKHLSELFDKAADFWLLRADLGLENAREDVALACTALYLSAVGKLMHVRRGAGKSSKILHCALDTVMWVSFWHFL